MNKRTILSLQFGAVIGAAMVLWLFLEHAFGFYHQYSHLVGITSLIATLIPVFGISKALMQAFAKARLTWRRGLFVGGLTSCVMGIIYGIGSAVYVWLIYPELAGELKSAFLTSIEDGQSLSAAELAEVMPIIEAVYTPLGIGAQFALATVISGLFITVLTIALMRSLRVKIVKK